MARREATPDESYGKGTLIKMAEAFSKPGTVFTGVFLKAEPNTKFEKKQTDYFFKLEGGEGKLTVGSELEKQLAKLDPQAGEQIWIKFLKWVPAGNNERRTFQVAIDDHKPGAKLTPCPKPPAPSAGTNDHDPFGGGSDSDIPF